MSLEGVPRPWVGTGRPLERRDVGLPLTAAGYLKPVDVEGLAAVLPTIGDWIGKPDGEGSSSIRQYAHGACGGARPSGVA